MSNNVKDIVMKIRLGYACMSKIFNETPSGIITYTEYLKNPDINRVKNKIISNLTNLEKLIDYNIRNDFTFFRLTSKLIPLATKKEVEFDYMLEYKDYFDKISKKLTNMRVDLHPDQFTVLNSTNKETINNSIDNLIYNYNILKLLNVKDKVLILHIGSSVLGKQNSLSRFKNTFNKLPTYLKESIVLENDDKIYNLEDTLFLCESLNIPMVFDYHHYLCNGSDIDLTKYLKRIIYTWSNYNINPKMHFSSPKSKLKKEFRTHHDYIDVIEFMKFLEILKPLNTDIDIMIEAKGKDEAILRLVSMLKYYGYKIDKNIITI